MEKTLYLRYANAYTPHASPPMQASKQTHANTYAHTHTHTRAHTHARARTHARTDRLHTLSLTHNKTTLSWIICDELVVMSLAMSSIMSLCKRPDPPFDYA